MVAETMKMPEPIIEPTTTMVASNRPRPRLNSVSSPASVSAAGAVGVVFSDVSSMHGPSGRRWNRRYASGLVARKQIRNEPQRQRGTEKTKTKKTGNDTQSRAVLLKGDWLSAFLVLVFSVPLCLCGSSSLSSAFECGAVCSRETERHAQGHWRALRWKNLTQGQDRPCL